MQIVTNFQSFLSNAVDDDRCSCVTPPRAFCFDFWSKATTKMITHFRVLFLFGNDKPYWIAQPPYVRLIQSHSCAQQTIESPLYARTKQIGSGGLSIVFLASHSQWKSNTRPLSSPSSTSQPPLHFRSDVIRKKDKTRIHIHIFSEIRT